MKSLTARQDTRGRAELLRDSIAAARAARLRYVASDEPGITRRKRGRAFGYVGPDGRRVSSPDALRRIASLVIPPAWTNVWICSSENGHLQATGFDVRGRKQYRYHPRWRAVRDEAKYEDALLFAAALPKLRRRINRDLASPHLDKDKVVATLLRIMEMTRIRVGNDRYAVENDSYGLSTLLDQHATIRGAKVEFRFKGKGGKLHATSLEDPRLARIVKRCRDIPGQRLFQYLDDRGEARPVTSTDVNDYIRRATGHPFTAKEVRTWSGTVAAAVVLFKREPGENDTHTKRVIKASVEVVAEQLGNTAAICRKCYIHPAVLDAYIDGKLHEAMEQCLASAKRSRQNGLRLEENAVLSLLDRVRQKTNPALLAA